MSKVFERWKKLNIVLKMLSIVVLLMTMDTCCLLAKVNPILYDGTGFSRWACEGKTVEYLTGSSAKWDIYHIRPLYYIGHNLSGDSSLEDVKDAKGVGIGLWFLPSITFFGESNFKGLTK